MTDKENVIDKTEYTEEIYINDNKLYYNNNLYCFDCTTLLGKIKFFIWELFHKEYK
jgi:hypothetical protein